MPDLQSSAQAAECLAYVILLRLVGAGRQWHEHRSLRPWCLTHIMAVDRWQQDMLGCTQGAPQRAALDTSCLVCYLDLLRLAWARAWRAVLAAGEPPDTLCAAVLVLSQRLQSELGHVSTHAGRSPGAEILASSTAARSEADAHLPAERTSTPSRRPRRVCFRAS